MMLCVYPANVIPSCVEERRAQEHPDTGSMASQDALLWKLGNLLAIVMICARSISKFGVEASTAHKPWSGTLMTRAFYIEHVVALVGIVAYPPLDTPRRQL